ncbi:asparagine synthetase B family protein [Candidatus Latescibacterota bacterium]
MCGLAGIAGPEADVETVTRMVATLAHRGPDHSRVWNADGIALGHARLSIVDLSPAGHQPLSNEDSTIRTIVNGEIYNAPQLRRELERCGHRFSSKSDSEVILHLYEESGAEFLPRLNGMFAFALWDEHSRTLLLARDRLGIKPLYIRRTAGSLIFASEVKALDEAAGVAPQLDPQGLAQCLAYANQFGSRSMTSGVEMLEPGTLLQWRGGAREGSPILATRVPLRPDGI